MPVNLSFASFFTIEAREYANFTFDAAARTTVRNVILGFAIGILIAALYAFYQKNVPGKVIHALLRAEAFSEETAKTAAELGLDGKFFALFELKHNAMLKKLVVCVCVRMGVPRKAENEADGGEEADGEAYYIPEELKYRAEVRYEKKGNGPVALIITVVLTAVLAILLIRLTPALLTVADHILK